MPWFVLFVNYMNLVVFIAPLEQLHKSRDLGGRSTFFNLELVELELFSLDKWDGVVFRFGSRDVGALLNKP